MECMDGARRLLLASFLAMESPSSILKLARDIGDGFLSDAVQSFFYRFCLNNPVARKFPPSRTYLSRVLKVIILAAESEGQEVLDDLYNEHIAILSFSESYGPCSLGSFYDGAQKGYKSYLYSISDDAIAKLASCLGDSRASKFRDLVLTLRVSSNMLEGSTGCYAWPAGIFLSEFLLTHPAIFSGRTCIEIGAGAGLSSICLFLLHASKVIATDGNHSTLANLKHNLAINALLLGAQHQTRVECQELRWESASEDAVAKFGADIIVGADLIYDPLYIPNLVQLLTLFLSRGVKHKSCEAGRQATAGDDEDILNHNDIWPIAYLATVIRNIDTVNMFISSACQAGLIVEDVTETMKPPVLLPQVTDIDRSAIRVHRLSMRPL